MRRLKDLVGLPALTDGRCVGRVLRGEPDAELRQLEAIWVGGGWSGARRISREGIRSIGEVAVLVTERGRRGRMPVKPFLLRAISTDGTRIGAVADAEIDGETLRINALWLSCGYADDLLRGRRRIEKYAVRPTDGAVLVSEGEEEETHE